jgi:hypothetical protein
MAILKEPHMAVSVSCDSGRGWHAMSDTEIIHVIPENLSQFSICGYKNPKKPGYTEKAHWLLSRMSESLRMLVFQSSDADFSLLVKTFGRKAPKAAFGPNVTFLPEPFYKGLVIARADQCPYTVANVTEMVRVAKGALQISPKIVELKSSMEAQHSPCPFGTFGIFYKGKPSGGAGSRRLLRSRLPTKVCFAPSPRQRSRSTVGSSCIYGCNRSMRRLRAFRFARSRFGLQ